MPRAWRLVRHRHAATAFDGTGAKQNGGRFNSVGTAVVYAADSLALAVLEVAVNVPSYVGLRGRVAFELDFEDDIVEVVDEDDLPADWQSVPPSRSSQRLGDEWVREARSAVLMIPGAILPVHSNYVLNPEHPDFNRIEISGPRPVPVDDRLIK